MGIITRLNLDTIPVESFIGINGRPGSGKTTAMLHIVYAMRNKIDSILLVTESYKTIKMAQGHIPELSYIHVTDMVDSENPLPNQMSWNEAGDTHIAVDEIARFIGECRTRFDRAISKGQEPRRSMLILDDCSFDKSRLESKMMRNLYSNFRQLGIFLMIIAQELFQLPKAARNMITHAISFRMVSEVQQKEMHKSYYNVIDDFKTFKKIITRTTAPPKQFIEELTARNLNREELALAKQHGPRGCLVYDGWRGANAETYRDCIFYFYPDYSIKDKEWLFGNPIYHECAKRWFIGKEDKRLQIVDKHLQTDKHGEPIEYHIEDDAMYKDLDDSDAIYLEEEVGQYLQ